MTPDVTMCVVTTERPTLEACLATCRSQTMEVLVDEVRNVSPMDAAFRQMAEQCTTPYLIQVDDDMLLYEHCAAKLRAEIVAAPENVWMVCGYLWDTHLHRPIQGVKIYKADRLRELSFNPVLSCEVDQNQRAKDKGWKLKLLSPDEPLGYHEIGDRPQTVFERYRLLALKGRMRGYDWPNEVAPLMLRRLTQGTWKDRDVWALAGALVGHCEPIAENLGEDDGKRSDEFRQVKELLNRWQKL